LHGRPQSEICGGHVPCFPLCISFLLATVLRTLYTTISQMIISQFEETWDVG